MSQDCNFYEQLSCEWRCCHGLKAQDSLWTFTDITRMPNYTFETSEHNIVLYFIRQKGENKGFYFRGWKALPGRNKQILPFQTSETRQVCITPCKINCQQRIVNIIQLEMPLGDGLHLYQCLSGGLMLSEGLCSEGFSMSKTRLYRLQKEGIQTFSFCI